MMSRGRAHGALLGPLAVFAVGMLLGVALWRFLSWDGVGGNELAQQGKHTAWAGGR